MSRLRILTLSFASLMFVLALASSAHAQASRTWVSGTGDDTFPCSRTAPCRTYASALSKTFINGEINILDPGSYGTASITKSITIDGNGFQAATLASGVNAFTVNIAAGNANDPHRSVRLKNLAISGMGPSGTIGTRTGLDGIRFLSGTSLFVENVTIHEFSGDAIEVAGPLAEANTMSVVLDDVLIRNCNGSGVKVNHGNASGQVALMANNLRVHATAIGVDATNRTRISVKESVFSHNTTGLRQNGSDNIMNLDDIFVAYGTTGLQSSAGGTIRLSDSVIIQNGTGLSPNGGTITSLNGNSVTGNTTDGSFNGLAVPKS